MSLPDILRTNGTMKSNIEAEVSRQVQELSIKQKAIQPQVIVELAEKASITNVVGLLTSKADERTKYQYKIREFYKLYENDSITFSLVNFLTQRIVPSFVFMGEKKETIDKLNAWAKRVHLKSILENILKDVVVGGNAWFEPIWGSVEIEKFRFIKPENMDLIRDQQQNTKYDENGDPEGYIQNFNGSLRYWRKDSISDNNRDLLYVAKEGEDLRKKLCHFKLVGYGDSELGLSMIQPIYRSAIVRDNIEDMIGESAFRGGGIIAYINGDLPIDVKKSLKIDLQNITSKNIFLLSDKIKLDTIPVPDITNRQQLIYLLADMQCAGMLVPTEIILSGDKAGRGNIADKVADLEIRIESYQYKLAEQLQDFIINPLLEKWGISDDSVEIKFSNASPANLLNEARVIATIARRNLMTYDPELELYIRRKLQLPTTIIEKDLADWIKNGRPEPQPLAGAFGQQPSTETMKDGKGARLTSPKGSSPSEASNPKNNKIGEGKQGDSGAP